MPKLKDLKVGDKDEMEEKMKKIYDPTSKKRLCVLGLGGGITIFEELSPIGELISDSIEESAVLATKALDHFGNNAQICQTMEECAELIVALNKALRDPEDPCKNVLEELADVTIMVEQMKQIFDENLEFYGILKEKMNKLRGYLENQEAER